ncbi:YciI family protein [Sphaerotilaceae bacterium SBD11-9]
MLYSILIYGRESQVDTWTPAEEAEVLGRHAALRERCQSRGALGPVMRLMPLKGMVVQHRGGEAQVLTDGPFAETKEQLMGIYVIDCDTPEEAIEATRQLDFRGGRFELRPLVYFDPGVVPARIPPEGG